VSIDLLHWLGQHANDYDLVHIHALWSFATAVAARVARRFEVPYILRPAGMLSNYSRRRSAWKKQLYWRLVERRTVRCAAAFHATSAEEAAEVRAVRPDARIFVIPNGVDDEAFVYARDVNALRQRCGKVAGQKPIVLFLSRLHPKKGILDRLLPAMAAMPAQCVLAIVGADDPHSPAHSNEVRAVVDALALQDRVVLLGPIEGEERWSLFDGADAFVLPSHAENFGIVVAEAMARACPVVVTDGVQSSTHVLTAGAGEVVSGDISALAGALDRVVSQPQLRERYGAAGRVYAEQHFRWNQIAQQVSQMYTDCIAAC
jgi:glycosyltransferase involved in cell wall biosynthesis